MRNVLFLYFLEMAENQGFLHLCFSNFTLKLEFGKVYCQSFFYGYHSVAKFKRTKHAGNMQILL